MDPATPLLERVKFFCFFSSNLDEFFEVRVAGLKQQMDSPVVDRTPDGLTATENLRAVTRRVRQLVERQYKCWREDLLPALAASGIRFLSFAELSAADRQWVETFYRTQVRPVLTPLDWTRPILSRSCSTNRSTASCNWKSRRRGNCASAWPWCRCRACCRAWSSCPSRLLRAGLFVPRRVDRALSGRPVPRHTILGYWHFRVTRNSELYIDEEETASLLKAVESEWLNRRRGDAVRLEVEYGCRWKSAPSSWRTSGWPRRTCS